MRSNFPKSATMLGFFHRSMTQMEELRVKQARTRSGAEFLDNLKSRRRVFWIKIVCTQDAACRIQVEVKCPYVYPATRIMIQQGANINQNFPSNGKSRVSTKRDMVYAQRARSKESNILCTRPRSLIFVLVYPGKPDIACTLLDLRHG